MTNKDLKTLKKKKNNNKFITIGLSTFLLIVVLSIFFYNYMNHRNAELYYERAVSEIQYNNTYQAGQFLKGALYFDDKYGDAYFLRGKIRCEFYKEYNLSLSDLDKALEYIDEPNSSIYYFKGKCNYMLGNYKESINNFETAAKMEPVIDSISYYLADIKTYHQTDYKKAIELYTVSLNLGKSYQAYTGRALCWQNLKEYKKAIDDYSKAINLKEKDGNLYYKRALCYFALNDIQSGCTDCGNAITLDFEEAHVLASQYCYGTIDSTAPEN